MTRSSPLKESVARQIALLRAGEPLQAFDAFYAPHVVMYSNDVLFASTAAEARAKQVPFITAATSISGRIVDVTLDEKSNICVFRNLTTFTDATGAEHQIDGLCRQHWQDGLIVEERYYDGAHAKRERENIA